jgi:trehalose 6-phosphate phosphatase
MVISMDNPLPESTDGWALFLDIDGTLIDIAPTPDSIVVPPDLPSVLDRLCTRMDGALALLTGRSIETVDRLFAPALLPVAGVHGSEIRLSGSEISRAPPAPELAAIRVRLAVFASSHAGALLEEKGTAIAVHYRADPSLRDMVESEVRAAATAAHGNLVVQPGKMVFEIRPAHTDKGRALETFMRNEPFRDKRPLAVGDDVTDETMFQMAKHLGGGGLRVGNGIAGSAAPFGFANPAAVRAWLAGLIRS